MSHEPNFDELVGTEATGAERKQLRETHELLLRAGPPPELTPRLKAGPNLDAVRSERRRVAKRRTMLLLAATLSIVVVFAAGYLVAGQRSGGSKSTPPLATIALRGTVTAPHARGTLDVWRPQGDNWPMTLTVDGLPQNARYEVYLVRDGRPWGSCGAFVVSGSSGPLTLKLNAPYKLRNGDSWVVTRQVAGGSEPGVTVMQPVPA